MKKIKYYFSVLRDLVHGYNWLRCGYKKLITNNGTQFIFRNFMDLWTITETYVRNDYGKLIGDFESDWVIVDIGAAIGDFSILASEKSPLGKVYAIEPFPESFYILNQNINSNNKKIF